MQLYVRAPIRLVLPRKSERESKVLACGADGDANGEAALEGFEEQARVVLAKGVGEATVGRADVVCCGKGGGYDEARERPEEAETKVDNETGEEELWPCG